MMNKKFKKVTSLLLVFLLLATTAACTKETKETTSGTSTNSATKEDTTVGGTTEVEEKMELEHVNLTLYYPGTAQTDEIMVEEEINKYLKEKINVTLDLIPLDWGAWFERPNLMIASGEEFDIMFTASWNSYDTNVARGAFLPLNDLVDNYAPEIKEVLDEALLEGAKVNGEMYGIPTNKEIAASSGLLFNKELIDKYGFDLSTVNKIEDIEPWLQIILENEPDTTPFFSDGTGSPLQASLIFDPIGDIAIPGVLMDGKVVNQYTTPETEALYALGYKWMQAGYINKDANQSPTRPEKFFCFWVGLKPGKDAEMSVSIGKELVQKEFSKTMTRVQDIQGSMLAISRTTQNPERAMMLIGLMNTDVYLNNLMNWGIENVHYTKSADGILSATDATPNYSPGTNWMFQNQFINYLWDNEDPEKWQKFRDFNKTAEISPLLGFVFDPSPVVDEIAALRNAMAELGGFATGVLDYQEYKDIYQEAMEAAGLNKVLEEKQRQVDAFLNN